MGLHSAGHGTEGLRQGSYKHIVLLPGCGSDGGVVGLPEGSIKLGDALGSISGRTSHAILEGFVKGGLEHEEFVVRRSAVGSIARRLEGHIDLFDERLLLGRDLTGRPRGYGGWPRQESDGEEQRDHSGLVLLGRHW